MMFCTGCGRNLRPAQEPTAEEEQKKPGFLDMLKGLFSKPKALSARAGRRKKEKDAAQGVPAEELSAVEETIIAAPAEELPGTETPEETMPAEELPGTETPEEAVPAEELPGAEAPAEAVPVEELPGAETPGKATPAEKGAAGDPEKAAEAEQEPEPKKGKKAKKGKSAGEAKEKKAKRSKNAKPVEVTPQKGGKKKLLIIVAALVAVAGVVFVMYLRAERAAAAAEEEELAAQETQAAQEEPAEQEAEQPAEQESAQPAEEQQQEPLAADLPAFEINGLLGLPKDALNQELGEAPGQLMTSDMCVEWHEDYNMAVHYLNDAAGALLLMDIEGTKMSAAILGVRPGSTADEADAALLGGGGEFITETSVADNGRWTRIYKIQTPDGQESNVFLHLEGDTVFAVVFAVADAYSGTDIGQKFYDAEYFVWLGSRSEEVSAMVE